MRGPRLVLILIVVLGWALHSSAQPQPQGTGTIVGTVVDEHHAPVPGAQEIVVFAAPRDAPKPTIDSRQTSSALVEQFKNERYFGRQMEIAVSEAAKAAIARRQ